MGKFISLLLLLFVATVAAVLFCCSSSNASMNGSNMGTVQLSLSDPATCSSPQGPFLHVYVTVTDVKIHQSASAADSDPGWVDLAPNLISNPV